MAKTVLIIDDDRLVLKTLARYLKNCGYLVVQAMSGAEALEKVEISVPDLIISDIRMPGMSGIETIRRIREQADNHKKSIPAIVITGYAGDEPSIQDGTLGIAGYLYKPFEIDEFIKVVKDNLETTPNYKRAHQRILATLPVRLKIKRQEAGLPSEIPAETLTLSEGGLSISTIYKMPLDLEVEVFLEPPSVHSPINADARIVWSYSKQDAENYSYGLQFLNIQSGHISILREILNKHQLLSKQFISLTTNLQKFVKSIKLKFDEFDKTHLDEQSRIEFLKEHRKNVFDKFTEYFNKIWDIVKDFDRVRYIIHKDYYQRALGFLLIDPVEINRRIYQKPLGYPGDYVIMEYIYDYSADKAYLGSSTYEKLINNYTCGIPVSRSNVVRKDFLKNIIGELICNNKTPKIISLGCGSARELIEVLREGKMTKPTLFKCLDLEIEALKYIENSLEKISLDGEKLLTVKYLHRDITGIIRDKKLRDEVKDNNLIYLSGVYDYLSDKMGERIISELYTLLEKDGTLIVCNISLEHNTHRAYYELLGEWCMIHRTEEQMSAWLKGLKGVYANFVYPRNGGNYHFLVIKKISTSVPFTSRPKRGKSYSLV
ncbi:MAG: response regulator [Candidatus Omnitrophica bacterium]|nr:response regulator [Candidatus Omnitrophota bacterium]